jgi:uncharacterized protein YbaR (Trm112 family)
VKKSLIEILACPTSKAALVLSVVESDGDEVVEGGLTCPTCDHQFPIRQGVPNLLPWDGCTSAK